MTLVKQPPTNGKTSTPTISNTNGNGVKKEEVKNQPTTANLPVLIPEKKQSAVPSIEDKFLKMDVLFSHREKYEKLKESLDKLNKFKLSTDGRNDNIILKDANNVTFSTYNPVVIAKVTDWLKEDLTKQIADVAALIIL